MSKAVVVWDPSGKLPDGSILEGNEIAVSQGKGVLCLPVQADLLARGGAAGWSKRSYGRGWQYNRQVSAGGCPLVLQVASGYPVIHWLARLLPVPDAGNISGMLRLAGDTAQIGAGTLGLSLDHGPVYADGLGAPDEHGGWTIGGRCKASISGDRIFAMQLYGYLSGARVLWLAASQST